MCAIRLLYVLSCVKARAKCDDDDDACVYLHNARCLQLDLFVKKKETKKKKKKKKRVTAQD